MVIFRKARDISEYLGEKGKNGAVIGFVPTMGALHAGHRSLIEQAKQKDTIVVCSIFINPTQFNDKKDFEKYPVSETADIALLIEAGCDVLFLPSVEEMYPAGDQDVPEFDLDGLDTILEGAHRPGHFKGVAQIVGKLLDITNPRHLYLGQKDYQQCMVLKKLLERRGKADELSIVICPTIREADGLAMSSRNLRLTDGQRALSATIYQCLVSIQGKQGTDSFGLVQKECLDLLRDKGFYPEYVALADAEDLSLMDNYDPGRATVALIAAKIGDVRLIDNMLLN